MEAVKKEIMDQLFQGKITIQEAAETLNISEGDIHNMIDVYEYMPTSDEIIEANSIIQDNLNHIENEVFLINISNFPQSVRPTDANEFLENIPEKEKLLIMTDSTGVTPHHTPNPFESYYHW